MTYFPHIVCLRGDAALVINSALTDILIALAYYAIPVAIATLRMRRSLTLDPTLGAIWGALQIFIMSCGTGHAVDAANLWLAQYWLKIVVNYATVLSSLWAVVVILRHGQQLALLLRTRKALAESLHSMHEEFMAARQAV